MAEREKDKERRSKRARSRNEVSRHGVKWGKRAADMPEVGATSKPRD